MPFLATWMDLEIIILREVSQRQIPHDITLYEGLLSHGNDPICKIENRLIENSYVTQRERRRDKLRLGD